MTLVDPAAAIDRAMSVSRWRGSGLCLDFVDSCMGRPGSKLGNNGGPPNGAWQEAKDGWYFSERQHPGDMDPPPGVPCYWETGPSGNTAGHIVISLGGGLCRTTDYAGAASVSTQTIASITRARVTRAHPDGGYLGWTEDYGGNPIDGIGATVAPAVEEATPIPEEEDEMKGLIQIIRSPFDPDSATIPEQKGGANWFMVNWPEKKAYVARNAWQAEQWQANFRASGREADILIDVPVDAFAGLQLITNDV